jgi:hypothetical protein
MLCSGFHSRNVFDMPEFKTTLWSPPVHNYLDRLHGGGE